MTTIAPNMKISTYKVAEVHDQGSEIDVALVIDGDRQFAIHMGGYYTVSELEWMLRELKQANANFDKYEAHVRAADEIWAFVKAGLTL